MVSQIESDAMAGTAASTGGTICVEGIWSFAPEHNNLSMDVSVDASECIRELIAHGNTKSSARLAICAPSTSRISGPSIRIVPLTYCRTDWKLQCSAARNAAVNGR